MTSPQPEAAGQVDLSGDWDSIAAGRLPLHHRDPFDRILVAQAATEGLTLVSRDESIALYDMDILEA